MGQFIYPTWPVQFRRGRVDWDLNPSQLKEYIQQEEGLLAKDKLYQAATNMFQGIEPGSQWHMTPAEFAIYSTIVRRKHPRVQVMSSTQYGKTFTIARALLTVMTTYPDEWLVTVPDTKRGKVLLNYMIKDTYYNDYFKAKLIGKKQERDEMAHLLEERSKVKLTYQVYGNGKTEYSSVEILTTEARRKQDVLNSVMGFGGKNVISDESSLIDDELEAGIFRMLAGKGADTFYCKIGNPFFRNHFFKSWRTERYKKIYIDDRIGLADGRYMPEFIEEAHDKPKYSILFACQFPDEDEQDSRGYYNLLSEGDLDRAITNDLPLMGELRMACDVAGEGRNYSTIVLRGSNGAKLLYKKREPDGMIFATKIAEYAEKLNIKHKNIAIDKNGIGYNVWTRVQQLLSKDVKGIVPGEKPYIMPKDEHNQYKNLRAQMSWLAGQWINQGGKLVQAKNAWDELLNVRYKIAQGERKIQMMSKKEMQEEHIDSPDVWDALAMTFAWPEDKPSFDKKKLAQINQYTPTSKYEGQLQPQ